MAPADPTTRRPPSPTRGRGSARAAWVPKQHGAWAMLTVPFLVGMLLAGPSVLHVPLLVAWVVGYLGFAAAGLWFRSRRRVVLTPVLVYGGISLVAGLVLVALRPGMLGWLPVFAPLAAVSLWFSARRDDRSIVNDVVTILAACLVCLVAASAGARFAGRSPAAVCGDARLVVATGMLSLYFVGTSLYVKTLIRERRSRRYRRASVVYHATATMLATLVPFVVGEAVVPRGQHALLVAFFAVTTARATVLAGRRIRPMKVGLGEIALSTALALILLLAA